MSTASAVAGTVLIALSLGATPGMDRTLAASATTGSSTLRATAVSSTFIGHDTDGDGGGHGHDGHDGHDGGRHGHGGEI